MRLLLLLLLFVTLCLMLVERKVKIALFTIITGEYESHVRESFPLKTMPMLEAAYVVTDNALIKEDATKKGWDCIFVNKTENSKKAQRKMKVLQNFHPDLHVLNQYDVIIYIDGNNGLDDILKLDRSIREVQSCDIVCFDHPTKDATSKSSNAELTKVLEHKLISKDAHDKVKSVYIESNYPDNIGLSDTRVLIRKNNENVERFCNEWINNMIDTNCYRDQVFFEYALWKHEIHFKRMKNIDFPFKEKGGHLDRHKMRANVS